MTKPFKENFNEPAIRAMAAGIEDKDWRDFSAEEKGRLNRDVEDLRELLSHDRGSSATEEERK